MLERIKKIIIDVDGGPDDAHALLILLYAENLKKVKIEAIICSSGNAKVDYVCQTVLRFLKLCNRIDIPVFKGSNNFLIPRNIKIPDLFGKDGFGDLKYENQPDLTLIKHEPAAIALEKLIKQNPKGITLVCLAPLTNVALAIKLFEDFTEYLQEIFVLGGNYTAVGFEDITAEFNMFCDPEAMHILLDNIKCPLRILPWETCVNAQLPLDWRFDILGKLSSPQMHLLNLAEQKIQTQLKEDFWIPCDAYLASCVLYPDIILEEVKHDVSIELDGTNTRGQLILNKPKNEKTISIIKKIDSNKFCTFITDVYKKYANFEEQITEIN